MSKTLQAGQPAPAFSLRDLHQRSVRVPDPEYPVTHLQFRRFAGCPICNLHLQEFVARIDALTSARIREVVVFHSSASSLLDYQGKFPFHVLGDPEKTLYKAYGVESSAMALLTPAVWPVIFKSNMAKHKPPAGRPEGGPLGLPADFLIDAHGQILARHYGKHANDQWSLDEVLAQAAALRVPA